MKKILSIFLAVCILFSITACGKDSSSEQKENGEENPWKEVSANDIYSYIGYQFGIPEKAKDIKYFWNDKDGIAEMQFAIDELNITARAKKTDKFEDISGMHYDFSNDNDNYGHGPDCFIWNNDQELRGDYHLLVKDDGCVSLGLWYYVSTAGNYSLSMGYVSDSFCDMSQYASEVFILEGIDGDPAEYSQVYWEEKYPGENVCPFYIMENGVEKKYYCVSSYFDGTMQSWVASPFNWNGWHIVDNAIVNKDETLKMTDNWAGENPSEYFSSFCTVTTEPYTSNSNTTVPEIETKENGEEFVVTIDEDLDLILTHKDDTITSMKAVKKYDSAELAEAALVEYNTEPDAEVESITVNDNVLTVVYKSSVWEGTTYSEMVFAFEMLKGMGGVDINNIFEQ